MNRMRYSWPPLILRAALVAVIPMVVGGISTAFAQMAQYSTPRQETVPSPQSQPVPTETLRPEVTVHVLAAQELMGTQKFAEALAKLREAEGVADRTAFENFVLDQMRGLVAARRPRPGR